MLQKKAIEKKRQEQLNKILLSDGPDQFNKDDVSGNLVGTLMKRTMAEKRQEEQRRKLHGSKLGTGEEMDLFMKVNVKVT